MAAGLLLAASAVAIEGLLHLACALVPSVDRALDPAASQLSVPDAVLGHRGNPRLADHDRRGYRNPDALARTDIAAIGDSHTYGLGVTREDAWPAALARRTGLTVYNMGFGGRGPGQDEVVLAEALPLHPSLVICTLYFGNDLLETFWFLSKRRDNAIPPALLDSADAAEVRDSSAPRLRVLFDLGDTTRTAAPATALGGLRAFLGDHSRLYGLAHALRVALSPPARPAMLLRDTDRALAAMSPGQRSYVVRYDAGGWRTVLTPAYRNAVLDPADVRIRAGATGAQRALERMDSVSRTAGARYLVLLLPTKESVFGSRGPLSAGTALDSVVRNEAYWRSHIEAFLDQRHIAYLDALPDLMASDSQTYFPDGDGHPNSHGHDVIAASVASWMAAQR